MLGVHGQPLHAKQVTHSTYPVELQVGLLHRETLSLLILPYFYDSLIFRVPWLRLHNPGDRLADRGYPHGQTDALPNVWLCHVTQPLLKVRNPKICP